MNLHGRVALVTGSARRVGRAIAIRLAKSGCALAIHYHRSRGDAESCAAACRESGVRAEIFAADLADAAEPARLAADVVRHFGRLDVLVNNASEFAAMTVETFDTAAWDRTLRVNLTAPMMLVHAAREALRAAGGRVVNLCDAAVSRPWPGHLAYIASKGGLETLTRALARALAPEVNVVGIAPGVADWPDDYDAATRERLTARIPLGRAGTPEEIAAAVEFVLREGDYISGTILTIDGGRHLA